MYVHLHNDVDMRSQGYSAYNTFQRFRATYTVEDTACGATLTAISGRFASPGYPNSYPMGAECVWTIRAPAGSMAVLLFHELDLAESDNCNADYVDVYKESPEGDHLGRFCGSTLPTADIPPAQVYWIKFNSDQSGSGEVGRGFLAEYQMSYGGYLSGTSGEIESVDYPHLYLNMEDTSLFWAVTVAGDKVVDIVFEDFQMETHTTTGCGSKLVIHDGPSADAPVVYEGCGYRRPDPVTTTSNAAYIVWQISSRGFFGSKFKLRWEAVVGGRRRRLQGWKFVSCRHCQELGQQASWLLIGCTRVINQSEARTARWQNS